MVLLRHQACHTLVLLLVFRRMPPADTAMCRRRCPTLLLLLLAPLTRPVVRLLLVLVSRLLRWRWVG